MPPGPRRAAPLAAVLLAACLPLACGGDDEPAIDGARTTPASPAATQTTTDREAPTASAGDAGSEREVPPAKAAPREGEAAGLTIGIGDQHAASLDAPAFRALGLRHARLVVPYDAMSVDYERPLVRAWLAAAKRAGVEPFVTFGHSRERPKHLPSVAEYGRAVDAFRRAYPQVTTFAPWNEINHRSQPTSRSPARAAAFHDALVDRCRGCTIVAGDLLDQAGMERYLRRYRKALTRPAKLWGLHNYSDTNRFRSTGTERFLAATQGDVWLTETGGIYRFGRGFPASERRQARAVTWSLRIARRFPRITRIYLYNWKGAPEGARFDSGLTDAAGRPRKALEALQTALR